jgi:hypothetical protein
MSGLKFAAHLKQITPNEKIPICRRSYSHL